MAKSNDNREDTMVAVEQALSKTESFFEKNQKIIMIAVAAVFLIVLGVLGYTKFISGPRELKANDELFMAQRYFEMDSLDLALNGDGQNAGMLEVISNYGSTKAGNLANYYAGICYLKKGEFQKAIDHLEDFSSKEILPASMALGAIADAKLELGKTDEAIELYKKAATTYSNEFTSPMLLMKAATALELKTNYAEAIKVYEDLKLKYPRSNEGRDADKYIERAQGLSGAAK